MVRGMSRSLHLGALLAAAALALPAGAHAHSHHLVLYKAERQIELTTPFEPAGFAVSCRAGDSALDGMWRVDEVEWHGVDRHDRVKAIHPLWSHNAATGTIGSTWTFGFENHAGGRAQVKLFATCLGRRTARGVSHTHGFHVGARRVLSYEHAGPAGEPVTLTHANACPAGWRAVAPGFRWTHGAPMPPAAVPPHGQIFRWYPQNSGHRNWTAGFVFDPGKRVELYQHCLRLRSHGTFGASSHSHRIVPRFRTTFAWLPPAAETELKIECGSRSKGIVGSWRVAPHAAHHVWWVGMDPRIRDRAYRFSNAAAWATQAVVGLLCVNDRTT
jgi:hypothetical protein